MCAAVGGVKLADQGGFSRLHQNGGRHYLGPDCKHARSPTSCLCIGAKPNRQVGHVQSGHFTSDLKVADRTKETLTKTHAGRANGSQQGELVRSTQLLVWQNERSIMDVTWMI